jgi:hypothetical protein
MLRTCVAMGWSLAVLVVGPAAYSEPAHLACEGAMGETKATANESYLMSLAIDLGARTVRIEGHPAVLIKGAVDEDAVAFSSPRTSDDVLEGSVNRITGEAVIAFNSSPMLLFHGRCHRADKMF